MHIPLPHWLSTQAFNRTIVELKLKYDQENGVEVKLLIVP